VVLSEATNVPCTVTASYIQFQVTAGDVYLIYYHKCWVWSSTASSAALTNYSSYFTEYYHRQIYFNEKERKQGGNVYVGKATSSGTVTLYFATSEEMSSSYRYGYVCKLS